MMENLLALCRSKHRKRPGILTVNSVPTFAIKWLVHHLADFSDKFPDINVRLDASLDTRNFQRHGIHVNIRLGIGEYPGLHVVRVFSEKVSPLCSPKLLDDPKPLRKLEDLEGHRILHIDWCSCTSQSSDWRMWVKAAGMENINVNRRPRFTVENMATEAAINAEGIALVSHAADIEDLRAGRLVGPFDVSVQGDLTYLDTLQFFRTRTTCGEMLAIEEFDAIDKEIKELIETSVVEAKAATMPDLSTLTTDVYLSY
jgi:LysR family glycine cleavage system transcriptional activator